MDLIIQVNPPTFLCCFSHTWASEDDERRWGEREKKEEHGVDKAMEKGALPQDAGARGLPLRT